MCFFPSFLKLSAFRRTDIFLYNEYVFIASDDCRTTNFAYNNLSSENFLSIKTPLVLHADKVYSLLVDDKINRGKTILFVQYVTFEHRLMLLIECLILYTYIYVLRLFFHTTSPSSIFIDIRCFVMMSIRH